MKISYATNHPGSLHAIQIEFRIDEWDRYTYSKFRAAFIHEMTPLYLEVHPTANLGMIWTQTTLETATFSFPFENRSDAMRFRLALDK
jgi:hypothetical protein